MNNIKLVFICVLLLLLVSPGMACQSQGKYVDVYYLSGEISEVRSPFSSNGITPSSIREMVSKINASGNAGAVVLRIDSPGGEVTASDEIFAELNKINKPVVVSCGSMVASGGYFISMAADKIVIERTGLVGSIGVISVMVDTTGLFDKFGLKPVVFSEGEHKDMYGGMRPLTEEEAGIMQDALKEVYDIFVGVVADGRGMDKQVVEVLATGQLYTASQSMSNGLVDEIGGLDEAIEVAARLGGVEKGSVRYNINRPPGILDLFLGSVLGIAQNILKITGINYQPISLEYR
jgi:protease-4